ncbi:DUF6615 family protein [Hymenobacter baengnokdamensis]|uniref:DUF6615 family protein n=1 Tax=Hymenobacter baengnokdamensis TaxID=2615203 RepID=UPI0012444BB4|nr:DUF6615 family protein [Hymenobacter baengnokdamensis]
MIGLLCSAFSKASVATWNRIQEGHSISYLFGEETLTDLLIRDLLRLRLSGFKMEAFSKPVEGRNGADWEWWFRGKSGKWLGLRVQAKVIDESCKGFKHLHHSYVSKTKAVGMALKDVYQCDRLIDMANNEDVKRPRVPLYCLYSYWNSLPSSASGRIKMWSPYYNDIDFGCSIVAAQHVQKLRIKTSTGLRLKRSISDTLPLSYPLSSLVCFPFCIDDDDSITERMLYILRFIGAVEGDGERYLVNSPPNYILRLLNRPIESRLDRNEQGVDYNIELPNDLSGVFAISQLQ